MIGEAEDSPDDFGRIAAFAAKQVINQRLRDIGDDKVLGEFKGREGDIVAGVIQQGPNPRMIHVDLGTDRGDPAARGAGAGRGLRARQPHPRLRHRA